MAPLHGAAIGCLVCVLLGAGPALAVDVAPLRLEITGTPGHTVTGTLTVTNARAEAVRVTAQPST